MQVFSYFQRHLSCLPKTTWDLRNLWVKCWKLFTFCEKTPMSPEKQAGKNKIMTCQQSKTDNKIRSNKPQQSRCQSALGMVFAFLSAICGATSGLLVKFVKGADADQIQFIRVCIQYICLLPLLTYRKESIVKDNRLTNCFLLSRAAFGMISHVTLIYSIGFLPLGDAMSIQYSYVTLVGLFAFFFLKGKVLCMVVNTLCRRIYWVILLK